MLSKLFGHVEDRDRLLKAKHHPVANTAAVITLNAVAGLRHVIQSFQWGYSDTPAGAYIQISINGTVEWKVPITAGGPGGFSFPIVGGVNQAVVLTLAAPGGVVVGYLNAQYTTESDRSK